MKCHLNCPTMWSAVLRSKRWLAVSLVIALVLAPRMAEGQTKDELTRRRDALNEQLATTERLLKSAKANRTDAMQELQLVDQKIRLREQLLRHHQQELRSLEHNMAGADTEIRTLEGHIGALKDEYARMIRQAYRLSLGQNSLMYLFAAEDFTQAVLRFRMLQSYSTLRKRQVSSIETAQVRLHDTRSALATEREEVAAVLANIEKEKAALVRDRSSRAALVDKLKGEEGRLRNEQKRVENERKKLNDAIKRIIESELAAERASSAGEFALTPAGKTVSAAFERNKGTLPWPVRRGVITGRFGRQNHPTLPGITLDNNGIDLSTDAGAAVLAVFGGTVSSIFDIPGGGATVIVSHGGYRTVYSNLATTSVSKGAKIEAGATLGKARTEGGKGVVHFEVWRVEGTTKTPVDPSGWLSRK